jgi:hypothetical protein
MSAIFPILTRCSARVCGTDLDPVDSRFEIIRAFDALKSKNQSLPRKKTAPFRYESRRRLFLITGVVA